MIYVTLRDSSGNTDENADADLTLTLRDVTAPVIRNVHSRCESDDDGSYPVDSTVVITVNELYGETGCLGTITINQTDPNSGEFLDIVLLEESLWDQGDGTYVYPWDTEGLPPGRYEVETTLTDSHGNKDADGLGPGADLVITIEDVTAPVVESVTSRTDEETDDEYIVGSEVIITVKEAMGEEGLTGTVTVTLGDGTDALEAEGALTDIFGGLYQYTWKTEGLEPGQYHIRVTLEDRWGNADSDGAEGDPDLEVTLHLERDPPYVVMTVPYDGQGDVALDAAVTMTFSEEMDVGSISVSAFTLTDAVGAELKFIIEYVGGEGEALPYIMMTPVKSLHSKTTYTITVEGYLRDLAGNEMGDPYDLIFTTELGERPAITYYSPMEETVFVNATESRTFSITYAPVAEDVTVRWYLEGQRQNVSGTDYVFIPSPWDAGKSFSLEVRVSRGEMVEEQRWIVVVRPPGEPDEGGGGEEGSGGGGVLGSSEDGDLVLMLAVLTVLAVASATAFFFFLRARKKRARTLREPKPRGPVLVGVPEREADIHRAGVQAPVTIDAEESFPGAPAAQAPAPGADATRWGLRGAGVSSGTAGSGEPGPVPWVSVPSPKVLETSEGALPPERMLPEAPMDGGPTPGAGPSVLDEARSVEDSSAAVEMLERLSDMRKDGEVSEEEYGEVKGILLRKI
jgi:hypothetical protein